MAKKSSTKCKREKVSFKPKHGPNKGEKISFTRKTGAGCPAPTRKTGHLRAYKAIMKAASPQCGKRFGYFNKEYGRCIRDAMKTSAPRG